MKWTLSEPNFGDVIRVKLGEIYHLGIYVDDDEVIQFGLPPVTLNRDPSTVEVLKTSVEEFMCGKFLEVGKPEGKEKKLINKPEKIVELAKSRLGEKGYHILYNNCEHFVNKCAFNKFECSQIDFVRNMFKNMPILNVYVKKYPFEVKETKIYPIERLQEIEKCSNIDVKNDKFYVWKLLEYAFKHAFGVDIKNVDFNKNGNKWGCVGYEFSLSHSNNVVAVAISRKPVGIDVEKFNEHILSKVPPERFLTKKELKVLKTLEKNQELEYLNQLWTKKEAVFKQKNNGVTINKIDTTKENVITKSIFIDNEEYVLSVASSDIKNAKFFIDGENKIK